MTSMILVGPISPEVWPGRRLSMFAEGGLKRTGVFSCTLEGDKGNDEVVQAIKIGKYKFAPFSVIDFLVLPLSYHQEDLLYLPGIPPTVTLCVFT